ncbi:hypothetical protein AB7W88_03095 [Providencia vermicola]|uniref:Uncharacterized protein n=2 Tax=Morganellaceae TaxID=1903414 RepID=A0AAI9HSX1_MORMO|nr:MULTISPECIES: hypothetical protein [Providencia]EJV1663834.1 hypothetical protein [Klebsiella pneumoniae]EKW8761621.1 hypothetical protein [Morganella morganii]THB23705.1 hypothetical protein E6R27_17585 [Providencia sp. MGF014]HEJ9425088.1 hypothetical protein [Proteus mirabilis]ELI9034792.1 hypothetical protein [Morganella morganii]
MRLTKFPIQLLGQVCHVTTYSRFETIKNVGFIKVNPDIPDQDRTGNGKKDKYPIVRTINGISVFDFRFVTERFLNNRNHRNKWNWVFNWRYFGHEDLVWISINIEDFKECFLSVEEVTKKGVEGRRNFIPKLEGAILSDIPLRSFNSISVYSRKDDKWLDHIKIID